LNDESFRAQPTRGRRFRVSSSLAKRRDFYGVTLPIELAGVTGTDKERRRE
jgi:hypothetical protein